MAIRKGGLGRGLDGMFPSYTDSDKGKSSKTGEKKSSPVKTAGKKTESKPAGKSTGKTKDASAVKAEITSTADIKKKTAGQPSEKTIKGQAVPAAPAEEGVVKVKISLVEPNREQPRKYFEEDALTELADSIRQYGIIQPLVVQKKDDYYEIIAGERRWRAAKLAGLKEVPVIVKEYSPQEMVEISLIENIQREDLNPIEEAKAYQRLSDEFGLKQDEVAEKVSKSRSTVTNSLRLLKLDPRVQQMLIEEKITTGHARALLAIENGDIQYETSMRVFDERLSVRDIERLVRQLQNAPREVRTVPKDTATDLIFRDMEDRLKAILGTKVVVNRKTDKKGRIEIEYYSGEDLERIFELLRTIEHGV